MHTSSLANAEKALGFINIPANAVILEVGGRNAGRQDRSYRSLFNKEGAYLVADIKDGPNVDLVMEPYHIPKKDEAFDLIISGQTLEHVKNPFKLVAEMKRVLVKGGCMVLIAPSEGRDHDRVDCWRFMRDSFSAIAEECGLELVANWIDRGPSGGRVSKDKWSDHTAILRKP